MEEKSEKQIMVNIATALLELKSENKAMEEILINKEIIVVEELDSKKKTIFKNEARTEVANLFGMSKEEFNQYVGHHE